MSLSKKTIKQCILASFGSLFWLFPPADLCFGTLLMLSLPSCQLQQAAEKAWIKTTVQTCPRTKKQREKVSNQLENIVAHLAAKEPSISLWIWRKNTARRRVNIGYTSMRCPELQTNANVSLCPLDMYTCNCLLTCDGQKPCLTGIFFPPPFILFSSHYIGHSAESVRGNTSINFQPSVNGCVGAYKVQVSYTAHLKQIKILAEQVGDY